MNREQKTFDGACVRVWLVLLVAATLAAYARGLSGGFLFDDVQNIVDNAALQAVDGSMLNWIIAALSSDAGMLMRPISMLSFAANYYISGLDPFAFKATNLAIHLTTGLVLFALSRRLIPTLAPARLEPRVVHLLALMAMATWLLHPLHLSSVLYVVQRMNQLATLFALLGLLCYAVGRSRMISGEAGLVTALSGLTAFGVLATFSKENGALVLPLAFIVEFFCFRFAAPSAAQSRILKIYFTMLLLLPASLFAIYLAINPDWLLGQYTVRDFTLYERILTQPRILAHYVLWILVPLPRLMGIYHDDIPMSVGLLSPASTVMAIVAILLLLVAAWRLRTKAPAFGFAVLWFLVGHAMESTILPLEMVFEHRNYLPNAGLFLGSAVCVWSSTRNLPGSLQRIGCATIAIALASGTAVRANTWSDPYGLAVAMAQNHPQSPRSLYDAGRAIYMLNRTPGDTEKVSAKAAGYFQRAMLLDAEYIHPAVSNVMVSYSGVEVPDAVVSDLTRRLREAPLFQASPVLLLLDRVSDGRIRMSPDHMHAVFEASMDNETTTPGMRATLLSAYGRYHFLILGNAQAAVNLTLAAAEQDPANPVFQMNIAKLAIELNEPKIAAAATSRASQLDVSGIYRAQISDISQRIESIRRGPP